MIFILVKKIYDNIKIMPILDYGNTAKDVIEHVKIMTKLSNEYRKGVRDKLIAGRKRDEEKDKEYEELKKLLEAKRAKEAQQPKKSNLKKRVKEALDQVTADAIHIKKHPSKMDDEETIKDINKTIELIETLIGKK